MAARVVFLGPPGGGKGTHAKRLSKRYGIPHISTGDILRERMNDGSPLGKRLKSFIENGKLVPDKLIIQMVEERLREPDVEKGFILDGFPRTIEQAKALNQILEKQKTPLNRVIDFNTSEEVIINRLSGRRICANCGANYHVKNIPPKREGICDVCGSALTQRKDDEEQTVRTRLKVYHAETTPLEKFYEDHQLLATVNGGLEVEPLEKDLRRLMDPL